VLENEKLVELERAFEQRWQSKGRYGFRRPRPEALILWNRTGAVVQTGGGSLPWISAGIESLQSARLFVLPPKTVVELLSAQDKPVLGLAGRGVEAAAKPLARADLPKLVPDVTEDAGVW